MQSAHTGEGAAGSGRRSTEDLQRMLESMMGDRESVLSHELPDLLQAYKAATGVTILEADELETVEQYCAANGDLELSPDSLFTFLSIMTQADKIHTPSLPTSVSLPSGLSIADGSGTTPRAQRYPTNRRVSDRVRSPSDSSSSDDDLSYNHPDGVGRPRNERHASAPPQSVAFPVSISGSASQVQLASLGQGHPGAGGGVRRKKTLSDSSRHEPPPSSRVRRGLAGNGPPPSSFGFGSGGGFARPSPAGRRRRGSTSGHSTGSAGDQDQSGSMRSPDGDSGSYSYRSFSTQQQQQMQRRRSSSAVSHHSIDAVAQSMGAAGSAHPGAGERMPSMASMASTGSMPLHDVSSPSSPLSPNFGGEGIDRRPFHIRAKSPDEMSEMMSLDSHAHAHGLEHDGFDFGDAEHKRGEGEQVDDVDGEVDEMGQMVNGRLGKLATESSASLRTSHDKLRLLQKQNTELARKLKESERQLSSLGAENERLVEDLQEKLEEARAEIAQRRKDEKEWKGKERTQMIQISGFEAEIQSLQRSLGHAKTNHASMQKMYNDQCAETQRLRDTLRDRDDEIGSLRDEAEAHTEDETKSTREIQVLEAAITQLNADLSSARQAESYLETQKQENLQLKETIDRMRYELDEARSNAMAAMGGGHTRGATGGTLNSVGGTMSRNLGDEISRRLNDIQQRNGGAGEASVGQEEEEEEVVDEGDSYEETVITTQRTRRVGRSGKGKATDTAGTVSDVNEVPDSTVLQTTEGPVIRIEEGVKEYADASVGTDPVSVLPIPAAGASQSEADPAAGITDNNAPAEGPPAYTRDPPFDAQRILDDAHPREPLDPGMTMSASSSSSSSSSTFTLTPHRHGHGRGAATISESYSDIDPAYEELVQEVGMRCTVLEGEMKRKAGERRKLGQESQSRRARSRARSGQESASASASASAAGGDGVVTVYLNHMGKVTGNALAMGAGIAGAALVAIGLSFNVPVPIREHELLSSMNSLVLASAAGEGLVPAYGKALWYSMGGAGKVLATRIPS